MFLAIIIPPAMQSKSITVTILLAGFISCIFYYTPGLKNLSSGWIIIISGIAASAFSALKFPVTRIKMNFKYLVIALTTMALATYLPRVLPLAVIK